MSSLCNGSFARHILLCSLFFISIDLRIPLVSHGLFNSFFCLFDTFWRGAQKFINFSTFLRNSSEDKLTSLRLKRSSETQSTFTSRERIIFLFFQSLGSLRIYALCYQIQVICVDFPLLKTEHDGLTMC